MTDFFITKNGDLTFEQNNNKKNKLKIMFYKTKSNALKIDIKVDSYESIKRNKNSLKINFKLTKLENDKRAMLVKDNAFLIQQIYMRLKTSLGELPLRNEIGSTIEKIKHKNLNDEKTKNDTEEIVKNAIKDILYEYSIKAIPKIINDGTDYKQIMKVMIYESNDLLFVYETE